MPLLKKRFVGSAATRNLIDPENLTAKSFTLKGLAFLNALSLSTARTKLLSKASRPSHCRKNSTLALFFRYLSRFLGTSTPGKIPFGFHRNGAPAQGVQ